LESLVPDFFIPERNITASFLKCLYRNNLFYTRTKEYLYRDKKTGDEKNGVQVSISKYGVRDSGILFFTFDEDNRVKFWNMNEDKTFINSTKTNLFDIVNDSIDYINENGYLGKIGLTEEIMTEENLAILKILVFARTMFHIGEKNGPFLRAHYHYLNSEEKKQEWTKVVKR
jgi:hypothetical protein